MSRKIEIVDLDRAENEEEAGFGSAELGSVLTSERVEPSGDGSDAVASATAEPVLPSESVSATPEKTKKRRGFALKKSKKKKLKLSEEEMPRAGLASRIKEKNPASRKGGRKNRLIYIVVGACAVAAVVVGVGIWLRGRQAVNEEYFVSDDAKTVISLEADRSESDESATHTNIVYTNDGDKITGLKTYFEYPNEEAARAAIETLKDLPEFKNASVEGKYIVVEADSSQFEGLTVSDVQQQEKAIREYQAQKKQEQQQE